MTLIQHRLGQRKPTRNAEFRSLESKSLGPHTTASLFLCTGKVIHFMAYGSKGSSATVYDTWNKTNHSVTWKKQVCDDVEWRYHKYSGLDHIGEQKGSFCLWSELGSSEGSPLEEGGKVAIVPQFLFCPAAPSSSTSNTVPEQISGKGAYNS